MNIVLLCEYIVYCIVKEGKHLNCRMLDIINFGKAGNCKSILEIIKSEAFL